MPVLWKNTAVEKGGTALICRLCVYNIERRLDKIKDGDHKGPASQFDDTE